MVRDDDASCCCCGLSFILKSFGGIMSCLFRSFRLSRQSSTNNRKKDRTPPSKNSLAALLVSPHADDGGSPSVQPKYGDVDPLGQANLDSELKDEAKFLKSCGTLLETPLEIRKTSKRVKDSLLHTEDTGSSNFHSWLPTTSMEKLNSEVEVNHLPNCYVKFCNDLGKESISPSTPEMLSVTSQCKHRSVHFEAESDKASILSRGKSTKNSDSSGCNQVKCSPYPTPLKLSDEMQTPGTAYPIYSHAEKARIRSQYVYNVLNPVQDFSQLMALKEVDYNNHKQVDSSTESPERSADACSENSFISNRGKENSSGKEDLDASLSHWLKHSSKNDGVQNCQSPSSGGSNSCKTSDMERPILGTVAAHWNADEPSRISPKWWDGNGIPNSTNKYKEDQKVSWHAIPFEERLEKALSNESLVSQRKLSPEPVEFVENKKGDTTGLKTS